MASPQSTTENAPNQRLLSIDALRGFDMFWIIGGDAIFLAIAKAGNWSFSPVITEQLEHADWEGFRFYDLIFPLFLFMSDASYHFHWISFEAIRPRLTSDCFGGHLHFSCLA